MNTRLFSLAAFALALLSGCGGFDPQAYVPGLETPTRASTQDTHSPLPVTVTAPPIVVTEPAIANTKVCTNIPNGKLNVRFEAGDQSDVRGYLVEGETVTISEESEELDGNLWVKLSHPIEGWVNANFLCEVKP